MQLSKKYQKPFYVYVWTDPKDGIPRYVGKGTHHRAWDYLNFKMPTRLSYLLRKRFEQGYICLPYITICKSEAEAHSLEVKLIAEIGREDLGKGPLFNNTDGGEGFSGVVFTASHKENLTAAQKRVWEERHESGEYAAFCERLRLGQSTGKKKQPYTRLCCTTCKREITTFGLERHKCVPESASSHGSP